jgi:DMSO/TMAO reductase YedYZ molybdopterin-dependent catalytic subunit
MVNEEKVKAKQRLIDYLKQMGKHDEQGRLPPGQRLTTNFPVLDLGEQPDFNPATWRLKITGLAKKQSFSYQDLLTKFPKKQFTADFHCVTTWSKYDVKWAGVAWTDLAPLLQIEDAARYLIQKSSGDGYSTNVPLTDLQDAFLAYELDGKPIPKEHGWPIRLIIPHLYGWKGAKFVDEFEFSAIDKPGFWEIRGYHNHGDVKLEERYS